MCSIACLCTELKAGDPARAREDLLKLYTKIAADYPIISIEDPFDQDDWDHTAQFTAEGVCQARLWLYFHKELW